MHTIFLLVLVFPFRFLFLTEVSGTKVPVRFLTVLPSFRRMSHQPPLRCCSMVPTSRWLASIFTCLHHDRLGTRCSPSNGWPASRPLLPGLPRTGSAEQAALYPSRIHSYIPNSGHLSSLGGPINPSRIHPIYTLVAMPCSISTANSAATGGDAQFKQAYPSRKVLQMGEAQRYFYVKLLANTLFLSSEAESR